MAEIDYDDSLLHTKEPCADVDWDSIEPGGLISAGKHLMTVKKVGGYLHNFKDYSGSRAKVQLQIKEGPDKGKIQYDDITLPHPQESDGSRNRRLLIASRMGLIVKGSKETQDVNWAALTGQDVVITVEHNVSKSNNKTYANVTFDGWEHPSTAAAGPPTATPPPPQTYADI